MGKPCLVEQWRHLPTLSNAILKEEDGSNAILKEEGTSNAIQKEEGGECLCPP